MMLKSEGAFYSNQKQKMLSDELSKRISQDNSGAQDAQDGTMEEIANWLRRGYKASEAERNGHKLPPSPHDITLPEHIAAEQYALDHGLWVDDDSELGLMGPSGDENYCYYNKDGSIVYKVNMLTHSGERIFSVFEKVIIHNQIFPETRYSFVGFTNMGYTRSAFPIFSQYYVQNAENASFDEIARHMTSLGFSPTQEKRGGWQNGKYLVWDLLPKNVLRDADGDIYVIDAEFIELPQR